MTRLTRAANRTVSMKFNLSLLGDMPERIEMVTRPGETRAAFIRSAIENEIIRRSEIKIKQREAERNRTTLVKNLSR
jgi:hypothetical protein